MHKFSTVIADSIATLILNPSIPSLTNKSSTCTSRYRWYTSKKKRNQRSNFKGAEEAMKSHIYNIKRAGRPCDFLTTTEFT